jgi:DNA adenine methylase
MPGDLELRWSILLSPDHAELLEILKAHPGPVMISGYACPLYDITLLHWERKTHDAIAERGRRRQEVLWLSPVAEELLQEV